MNYLMKRAVVLLIVGICLFLLLLNEKIAREKEITVEREITVNEKIAGEKEITVEREITVNAKITGKNELTDENKSTADMKITAEKKTKVKERIRLKKKTKRMNLKLSKTVGNRTSLSTCKEGPFISFNPQGRLGNRICEYIHLFHAVITNSIQGFVHPKMWDTLHGSFPNISLPILSEDCLKELENHKVQYADSFTIRKVNITSKMLLLGSPCHPSIVWGSRVQWQRELVFSSQLQENARARKLEVVKRWQAASNMSTAPGIKLELEDSWKQSDGQAEPKDRTAVPTVIGVHVRRGDYHVLLKMYKLEDLLPPEYYQRAFQYFREGHNFPLFVILTEPSQRPWCQQWLTNGTSDVVLVDDSSTPNQDLALLASMEHIIYSHGTFGLTAILLSNIKTLVYPAINTKSKARRYFPYIALDDLSKNWAGVNFVTVASTKL